MRLTVKLLETAASPSAKAVMLCDEEGIALPLQVSARLDQSAGDLSRLTVEFFIDGDLIRWAE